MAPSFLTRPSDVQVSVGDTVDLSCAATGHPDPTITWTLNDRAIRFSSRVTIVGGGLHIISLNEDDNGEYRCRAENDEGIITASARVVVQGNHNDTYVWLQLQ